jgi:pilus assembly protein FimV
MRSNLGQPLRAEIPIYDADEADLLSLNVSLGSEASFRRFGLDPKIYKDIQIQISSNDSGQYYILLQTNKPFNEPFFNVLIEADWKNGGRLDRQFTALVDPAYVSNAATQIVNTPTVLLPPVVAEPEKVALPQDRTQSITTGNNQTTAGDIAASKQNVLENKVDNSPANTLKNSAVKPISKSTSSVSAAIQSIRIPATQNNQLRVVQGDNLSRIATQQFQLQQESSGISLNQMMLAIQRANPDAFINGNQNLLKSGTIIRLPNEQQVIALLPEEAVNLLQKQWANKIMAQPSPVLSSANKLNGQSVARRSVAATAKNTSTSTAVNQGRLKIIPTEGAMSNAGSQSGASKSGQGQELRAENIKSQEEGAARQAEISTLKNQLTEAEKLQFESKRLIELQSSQIKQLTKRMQDLEKSGVAQETTTQTTAQNQLEVNKTNSTTAWYYSPFVILAGLLLVAGLLGMLLKQKRK